VIVSINQPAYLPWLGYFHRIAASDVHVVLDHVQFEKNSFVNRNKVLTANGPAWLTVPVRTSHRFGSLPIDELEIDGGTSWRRKHWDTIRQTYSKAPFFADHAPFFESVYARTWDNFLPLVEEITSYLLRTLDIRTEIVRSSTLIARGLKDELVLAICRELSATTYLSGPLGRNYLRAELFERSGIAVHFHSYRHPEYPQLYPHFEPFMAIVDLLFNCGSSSHDVLCRDQESVVE
jgi:hypothetical protein